ncbi:MULTISPECIES: phage tail tube protein [Providencia]|uniref:phage tail tube protein n=1 Tax=Providencia TaxID=586 RepID=UPI0014197BDD|nr:MULTISPECIES: phage tail tube protein [Providencia]ELR5148234.1 phage tail protein [Providencia rettgeri]ELR5252014.1 phage tail protein [Providencia rettgeri]NIA45499.1 phage tail protein [Providencia rettgeri]NIA99078.1 phage tail protein [Providencia rettgeri]NIB16870.1 phage tail protein [Providencia rettgeri]
MTSKHEKTQGTKISVSKLAATDIAAVETDSLPIDCTTKEISFTGGQKADIDVTTFCSNEQENINGLAAPAEVTIGGNFAVDEGQDVLRQAYDSDAVHAFKVVFPSGAGFAFLAEVRQNSWSAATNGVVSASFTLRLKGKPTPLVKGKVAAPATQSLPTGGGK